MVENMENPDAENLPNQGGLNHGKGDGAQDKIVVSDIKTVRQIAGHLAAGFEAHGRVFVQVRNGGDDRSVRVDQIVEQVKPLVAAGCLEVVLVGDNVAAYGVDLGLCDVNTTGLTALVRAILDGIPGLQRLRLGALDPARLDEAFFDLLASEPRLMGYLHLSLQAADDEALQSMNCRHAVRDVDALINEARSARPGVVFGANLIAGFPGETDAMFENTLGALKRWGITYFNASPYSTPSDGAAPELLRVPDDVIKARVLRLREAGVTALESHLSRLTGSVHPVLMEQVDFGRSESFVPVRLVRPVGVGQIVNVSVTAERDGVLLGEAMGDYKTTEGENAGGWLKKLKAGLGKSSERMTNGIGQVFTARRRLDDDAIEELEEVLITSDIGVATASRIIASLAKTRFDQEVEGSEVREAFATEIAQVLEPVAKPLQINAILKPHVILVCGVNGSGKTTTIGKLAKQFTDEGRSVMLAAGDTFRAAAIEQLQVWGERTGTPVIARDIGADSAGLVYDALEQARAEGVDILLIDTAGRLQNKTHLMEELEKVVRVIKKIDDDAPHDVVLVLDATVGQNAHAQVDVFKKSVNVSGLVMTKLDGTAKGGVVVALADKFALPIHAIGVGEGVDDLHPFNAKDFARNLMGLD